MTGQTRSALFSRFDPSSEKNQPFVRDLQALLGRDQDVIDALIAVAPKVALAYNDREIEALLLPLAESTRIGMTYLELDRACGLLRFFLKQWTQDDCRTDTVDAWVADLLRLGHLPPALESKARTSFDHLRERALPEFSTRLDELSYARGILPSLRSVGTTVELRAIQLTRYRWGGSLSEYTPTFAGVTGIVSIHIGLDTGNSKDIYFQAEPRVIREMINQLEASLRDLKKLVESHGQRTE